MSIIIIIYIFLFIYMQFSKADRDTLLQGTYNVSLNNPLAPSDGSSENMTRKQTFVVGV